ncbi:glutamine amidotransferase [Saccharopolyspora rhizosphaerae]|uniref:Lipid II isoglutaminyl synthase (glutamine-hydrolyzing) subunit GatD n=1 Tax=Saccharopolyspora rhizosphaerae TaxID=2492662 RepID=A0A426K583_9PSEU|nr:glutamine amidotransferase [Saccharopolyspora rhizosphaerae]RRO20576.1 glutamine amidotransferase [Saccharopolyspora rhizosphaerae]
MTGERVRIALVLPDLLGTYGDRGNAIVLGQRLRWRGIGSELVTVLSSDDAVPEDCDLYLIGGGEDVAQVAAVRFLRRGGGLTRAVQRGVPVLGICGGLQVLGTTFVTGDGQRHEGLGLVDAATEPGRGRAIGEVTTQATLGGIGVLTGFENHLGRTVLGPGSHALGRVMRGTGNGHAEAEGAVSGHVVCTYLHGPVLARNPKLADLLLEWALGEPLEPLPDPPELTALRTERTRVHVRNRK